MVWDGLVGAQDSLTALCAAFNALYFIGYIRRRSGPARRFGAAALVLVNSAMAAQALFFLALYLTRRWDAPVEAFFSPGVWLAARAPALAAAASMSLLIARQRRPER